MPKTVSASRTLALAACLLMLTGCAATSVPTPPAPEIRLPAPPVQLGPQHSPDSLQKAQAFSQKVQSYIDRLRALPTNTPPK